MKDPCDDCLVKVNCSDFCDEKKNYNTLCQDALKYYKNNRRHGKLHIGPVVQYSNHFKQSSDRDKQTFLNSNEILKRKTQRGR